jgi:hypothetical protein
MTRDWLTRQLTVQELETLRSSSELQALTAQMQPDDEIWEFSSPPESWQLLMGWAGIALVRDGEVIDSIVTEMN